MRCTCWSRSARTTRAEGQHATFAFVNKSIPRAVWWNHGADVEAIRAHDVPRDVLFTLLESDYGGDPHLELKLLDARVAVPEMAKTIDREIEAEGGR